MTETNQVIDAAHFLDDFQQMTDWNVSHLKLRDKPQNSTLRPVCNGNGSSLPKSNEGHKTV